MASLFTPPYFDVGAGITPADGALLNFYVVGSGTRKNTFTTAAATTAHANPVVAYASGFFPAIYISGSYDWVLTDKNAVQKNTGSVDEFSTGSTVSTIADIQASNLSAVSAVETLGYTTPGDGGAAKYWADLTDTASADDGFMVIVSNDGVRFKLIVTGSCNVMWAGATRVYPGSGSAGPSAAVDSAARVQLVATNFQDVYIPAGDWLMSEVTWPLGGQMVRGAGMGRTGTVIEPAVGNCFVMANDYWSVKEIYFNDHSIGANTDTPTLEANCIYTDAYTNNNGFERAMEGCLIERVQFVNIKGAAIYLAQAIRESNIRDSRFFGMGNVDIGVGAIHSAHDKGSVIPGDSNNINIENNVFYRYAVAPINLLSTGTTTNSPTHSEIRIMNNLIHNQTLEPSNNTFGQGVQPEETDNIVLEKCGSATITGNRITGIHPNFSGIKWTNHVDYEVRSAYIAGNWMLMDSGLSAFVPFTSGSVLPISAELSASTTEYIDSTTLRKSSLGTAGAIANPYIGDAIATLSGQTSGASGILQQISYLSGDWTTGDAAGVFHIKSVEIAFNASELIDNDTTVVTDIAATNGATTGVILPGTGNIVEIYEAKAATITGNTFGANTGEQHNSDVTITRTSVSPIDINITGNVSVNQPLIMNVGAWEGEFVLNGVNQGDYSILGKFSLGPVATHLIVGGEVTPISTRLRVQAATGVTDQLTGLTRTNLTDGDMFIIQADAGDTITCKDGTTYFDLNGDAILVGNSNDRLTVIYDAVDDLFYELSRVIH